jgi:hypothetical protein
VFAALFVGLDRAVPLGGLGPFLVPLLFQACQLHLVDGVAGFGSSCLAQAAGEAFGRAVAEHEHQQPVIIDRAGADQLAIGIDRHFDAVERAVHRDVLDPAHADVERDVPGLAEFRPPLGGGAAGRRRLRPGSRGGRRF